MEIQRGVARVFGSRLLGAWVRCCSSDFTWLMSDVLLALCTDIFVPRSAISIVGMFHASVQ